MTSLGAEESCRCLCVNLSNKVLSCTSFSYVLLRLTQRHRQLSSAPKDVTERLLLQINPSLAAEARKVLDTNKSERHIRGGLATREKYLHRY